MEQNVPGLEHRQKKINCQLTTQSLMKGKNLLAELVAPCGMNCILCKDYQAYINNKAKEKGKTNHYPDAQYATKTAT
jgi:hypothetical protein